MLRIESVRRLIRLLSICKTQPYPCLLSMCAKYNGKPHAFISWNVRGANLADSRRLSHSSQYPSAARALRDACTACMIKPCGTVTSNAASDP